jgi:hypothetical protein
MTQDDRLSKTPSDLDAYAQNDLDAYTQITARVQGGKCSNKQPLDIEINAFHGLADIDLSGCYGEGSKIYMAIFQDTEYTPLTDGSLKNR